MSMTGNSSILNFLNEGLLSGSFLTRTSISRVSRAMSKENLQTQSCNLVATLKSIITVVYHTMPVHVSMSQNKNKAKQEGSTS